MKSLARVEIYVPLPLRSHPAGRDILDAEGRTVGEALRRLAETDSELGRRLFRSDGSLGRSFGILLNDVDVRNLDREATPIRDGDRISILPSLSGG